MKNEPLARHKRNALLDALDISARNAGNGQYVVTCRELPGVHQVGPESELHALFEAAKKDALLILESGIEPVFCGNGSTVFTAAFFDKEGKLLALMTLEDDWCSKSPADVERDASDTAGRVVRKVGANAVMNGQKKCITVDSLKAAIIKAVGKHQKAFGQAKLEWQDRWDKAKALRFQEQNEALQIEQAVACLSEIALEHIRSGARLVAPWAVRGKQSSAAETWHLLTPDQFNESCRPPEQRHETWTSEDGHLHSKSWVENAGGGEIMTAGRQVEFMIEKMARFADSGDQDALRWLQRLGLRTTELFWHSVESNIEVAKTISVEWSHVPVVYNDSILAAKSAEIKMANLNMPKPPPVSGKIHPGSEHHQVFGRIESAINFLLRTPPVATPWTGVDESAPSWVKDAWNVSSMDKTDSRGRLDELFWLVYVEAMTSGVNAPWSQCSRPRKAKEKFMKAFKARSAAHQAQTP